MMNRTRYYVLGGILPLLCIGSMALTLPQAGPSSDPLAFQDASGVLRTVTTNGPLDLNNPFFQSLGTNGRACVTCHQPGDGWSVTPVHLRERFNATDGLDPIFHSNDGSNSPNADMSTRAARRRACSMLLTKGLIRVGIGIPANAEFTLVAVDDPYGYASAQELSLFRRPLPATNLRFLSTVMWDGRETVQPITGPPADSFQTLQTDLMHQALDATTGHAQASTLPTQEQLEQIVALETGLYTAQTIDDAAGRLDAQGGQGGPDLLTSLDFHIGINDTLGNDPSGALFDPVAFGLYDRWAGRSGDGDGDRDDRRRAARRAIARGERLFNTRQFVITDVIGLNDALHQNRITGTCTTCHNTPNVGDHSVSLPLNLGLTDASRRTPDMPLYTLRNKTTGQRIRTTDPGRALITGKWADIGKFKGPLLRGLAARPPYFHNGLAAQLEDVVSFYDTRFHIGLTIREKADLAAFLRSL
jgi:cytochrome c peroxidase